jgi:hypothetical protein
VSRRASLTFSVLLFAATLAAAANDDALWREYGLVRTSASKAGKLNVTQYEMKDPTGALAVWEWLRSPAGQSCDLTVYCTRDGDRTVVWDDNYVFMFEGGVPNKLQLSAVLSGVPNKRGASLPAILTFVPQQGLVPDSARYVLGPESLKTFAPELASAKPGFEVGAEAQVAQYKIANDPNPVRLAILNYPTPEMARLHAAQFKRVSSLRVKRSDVLVAIVLPPATDAQADTLLSRVQYEAKVTWNDSPPPSPIKPLYQLLLNIMYLSIILTGLCTLAGLIFAGMRIYRRSYGQLEKVEEMSTLHMTGVLRGCNPIC